MSKFLALLGMAVLSLTGCTVFTDDIYRVQAGYHLSESFEEMEQAIHDEFVARFGEGNVRRAAVEWKYNHWTAISDERAMGLERYRMRIYAYPQLGADGHYEPVVVAREEVYTGYGSGFARGGPTAMYSNKWTEAARDVHLEASLSNGINARLRSANGGGE